MKNHQKSDPVQAAVENIKSVKVQGATNVALAALTALKKKISTAKNVTQVDLVKDANLLIAARSTEPLLQNSLNFLLARQEIKLADIDLLLGRLRDVEQEIVVYGKRVMQNKGVYLTHCHSSSVMEIFKAAMNEGKEFIVFVTETRPLDQGRLTAEQLTREGIKVIMVTDSNVANILINGYEENGKKLKVNAVFVGADAIEKNGNYFYNKIGTFSVVQSAAVKTTPVHVVSTLLKVSAKKVVIEIRDDEEIFKLKNKNFDVYNPAFDKVSTSMVTDFITEFGVIKSKKIPNLTLKNYPFIFKKSTKVELITNNTEKNLIVKKENGFNPYKNYLHLGEKIDKKNKITATFSLKVVAGCDYLETAGGVAAESSIGTWTNLPQDMEKTWENLHAHVVEADQKLGLVQVVYSLDLFEPNNIPQLLSSVAGNIFGLKEIYKLKLLDLDLPEAYVQSFPGPAFGLMGVRKITGVKTGPLIGSIVKPKLGLTFKDHARVAMEVFRAGGHLVKDDENLTNQKFNPFFDRVKLVTLEMKKFHYLGCVGEEKIHAFNVTAESQEMVKRASFIKQHGGNCAMIDVLTAGFGSVQTLRQANLGLILHGHRALHAALTRDPDEGISMLVLAKLCRLAGIDELHTGTVVGKMEGGKDEVQVINDFLVEEWFGLKSVMPVASGGLHPGLVPALIKDLGENLIMNFGGGIHGHPLGTRAGVQAVLEALEVVNKNQTLVDYAVSHENLRLALQTWQK